MRGRDVVGAAKPGIVQFWDNLSLKHFAGLLFRPSTRCFKLGHQKNRFQSAVSAIFAMTLFQNGTKRAEPDRGKFLEIQYG
jgi:hypothetical protein